MSSKIVMPNGSKVYFKESSDPLQSISPSPWQSIETAPMDGTLVDLWVEGSDLESFFRMPDCFWDQRKNHWKELGLDYLSCTPLYWMPIPKGPEAW